jgi:hypothetical protein
MVSVAHMDADGKAVILGFGGSGMIKKGTLFSNVHAACKAYK